MLLQRELTFIQEKTYSRIVKETSFPEDSAYERK